MNIFEYYVIYKPFRVLSQFSAVENKSTLSDLFKFSNDIYPVGRLDFDSKGLLILTNDNFLKNKILNPLNNHQKTYFVQIEGIPNQTHLDQLKSGVEINVKGKIIKVDAKCAKIITEPHLPDRNPPIRHRIKVPTSWLSITITEGKNHQIRKMTAKVGFPTLRLVRYSIENLSINDIKLNEKNSLSKKTIYKLLNL